MKKFAVILIASAVLSALAGAQGGGGFRMPPGMEKMQEYGLLQRPDAQKDLKLTDDQTSKLQTAQQGLFGQFMQLRTDSQGDQDAMAAGMKKIFDGLETSIKGILTPEQLTRLHEINIQMYGAALLVGAELQKTLKMTDDQVKQVKALQAKRDEANASLQEKVQNGDIDRSEVFSLIQKNADALGAAIEKILTDDQRAQFKKMGGAPFAKDPNYKPSFGFGRPAGGGGGN